MKLIRTEIPDVILIEPRVFGDERGYFFESFQQDKFNDFVGGETTFVQDNESCSNRGVLRGLHFQKGEYAQGKLVRVVQGAVLDVAVDIRPSSPTFGKYVAYELSANNKRQLYVPVGFAHGFLTLEDQTIFQYKCTNYYFPQEEGSIRWNDPEIGIQWPFLDVQLSEKDKIAPFFKDLSR